MSDSRSREPDPHGGRDPERDLQRARAAEEAADQAGEAAAQAEPPGAGGEAAQPYRSLWAPLVVVPFLIVGVLVLIFVLFGAIAGKEASPEENLERMLRGGPNERQQAAFQLVRQVRADWDGHEDWGIDASILPAVEETLAALKEDEHASRYVLATMMAFLGDPQGREGLEALLALSEEADPAGELRLAALRTLAQVGDPKSAAPVIPFLHHEDPAFRIVAAGALRYLPTQEGLLALREALASSSLELRGTAAISLSHLDDPSGAAVLRELVSRETYASAREQDPAKFQGDLLVSLNRRRAVEALARLGLERELVEGLAAEEPDLEVREAALRALEEWGPRAVPSTEG